MANFKTASGTRRPQAFVRVEVRAAQSDSELIRDLAQTLRGETARAEVVRSTVKQALSASNVRTAFDIFGSDLPDETFADVFEIPRHESWRKVEM